MIGNSLSSGTCPILLKKLPGQQALNYALIDGIFFRRGKDRGWLRPGGVYHFDSPLSLGLA